MKCCFLQHFIWVFTVCHNTASMDPEGGGGQGVKTPLKNHKNIGFLSNTCPDPLKNHKATKPDSMLGHHRQDSEMPFKWHFTGRLIMARM